MKMKKVFLSIVVAIVLLAATTTNANAAEIKAAKAEYNVGDSVNVTVEFAATGNINLDLKYNKAFTYKAYATDNEAYGMLPPTLEDGMIKLGGIDLNNKITKVEFTFTADSLVENAEFLVDRLVTASGEAINPDKVTVSVVEAQKPSVEPEQPTVPTQPTNPEETKPQEPSQVGGVTENTEPSQGGAQQSTPVASASSIGTMPKLLPQTGISFVVIGVIVIAIIIAIVVMKKN